MYVYDCKCVCVQNYVCTCVCVCIFNYCLIKTSPSVCEMLIKCIINTYTHTYICDSGLYNGNKIHKHLKCVDLNIHSNLQSKQASNFRAYILKVIHVTEAKFISYKITQL